MAKYIINKWINMQFCSLAEIISNNLPNNDQSFVIHGERSGQDRSCTNILSRNRKLNKKIIVRSERI